MERGGIEVVGVPVSAFAEIATYLQKYADQDIDFANAALIWLANAHGERRILTVDERDFTVFRFKGGKRFELGVTSRPLLRRSELAREQRRLAGDRFIREQARSYRRLERAVVGD